MPLIIKTKNISHAANLSSENETRHRGSPPIKTNVQSDFKDTQNFIGQKLFKSRAVRALDH